MKKTYNLILSKIISTVAFFLSLNVYAQVGTSFENDLGISFTATPECRYFDTNTTSAHVLQNYLTTGGCGEITVNKNPIGNELGYTIVLDPLGVNGSLGFSDGDAFGVANNTGLIDNLSISAPDGSQAFLMEDTDGEIIMTFSDVSLVSATNPQFSMQYALGATSWETLDYVYIHIDPKNCTNFSSLTLIDTRGIDIDGNFTEGSWQTLNADLSSFIGCDVNLVVEFSSNASAEEFGIDNISFSEGITLDLENTDDAFGDVEIYLKPQADKILVINSPSQMNFDSFIVYDLHGRQVLYNDHKFSTSYLEFDMSGYEDSVYIIRIVSDGKEFIKKIILD